MVFLRKDDDWVKKMGCLRDRGSRTNR